MKEFDQANIFIDIDAGQNKAEALAEMAHLLAIQNRLDEASLLSGFLAREAESTTGFGEGVAIPHTQIVGVSQPLVAVASFDHDIAWESLDDLPVSIAIALLMPPSGAENAHLKILAKLARKLMNDEFVADLRTSCHDRSQLFTVIQSEIGFS